MPTTLPTTPQTAVAIAPSVTATVADAFFFIATGDEDRRVCDSQLFNDVEAAFRVIADLIVHEEHGLIQIREVLTVERFQFGWGTEVMDFQPTFLQGVESVFPDVVNGSVVIENDHGRI